MQWEESTDEPYMSGLLSVGTPGSQNLQTVFLMNFEEVVIADTTECKNCVHGANKYDPSKSTTKTEIDPAWTETVKVLYSDPNQWYGFEARGVRDKVCIGTQNLCSEHGNETGYAFLVAQNSVSKNVGFDLDAMVGLSPNPDTQNVESFGEYLKKI